MKNIPTLYQGDDIDITLTIGENDTDIIINGINQSEFDDVFSFEFGSDNLLEVEGEVLINNIKQPNAAQIEIVDNSIAVKIESNKTKAFEKGLLEVELLITYNDKGNDKHLVERIAIGWLKEAHTTDL